MIHAGIVVAPLSGVIPMLRIAQCVVEYTCPGCGSHNLIHLDEYRLLGASSCTCGQKDMAGVRAVVSMDFCPVRP
jgi:predicted RNA-binding Zn-ribbon protein involved in translation (DUF1610 family)